MSDAMLALVLAECEGAVKRCEGDVKAKLRAAMSAAKDHWMVLDKDIQLRGAVGAVMQFYGKESPEWDRLVKELDLLRQFNAFLLAAQAGLQVSPPDLEEGFDAIGILGMWKEADRPSGPGAE